MVEPGVALVLLALGVVYAVGAWKEGLGTMADTGPGFFPFLVAVVLVAGAGLVLLTSRRGSAALVPADEDDDFHGEVHWWRIVGVLVASALVPVVGTTVGMVTTLSIVLVVIAKIMGLKGWWPPIAMGLAFGVATWLIFVYWLYVPLPAGRLGLV